MVKRALVVLAVLTGDAHADPDVQFHGAFARVGHATRLGPYGSSAPIFGIGYRVDLPRLGFEITTEIDLFGTTDPNLRSLLTGRAAYVLPLDDQLRLRAGLGLGYGREEVIGALAIPPQSKHTYRGFGPHAELRVGVDLGVGPIASLDLGVRLPLFELGGAGTLTPAESLWAPVVDLTLSCAPSAIPSARFQGVTARLGYGVTPGPSSASGMVVGLGYRFEGERFAVDVGSELERLAPEGWETSYRTAQASARTWIGATGSYLHRVGGGVALRAGAGVGYGRHRIYERDERGYVRGFERDGVHASARAGLELGHGPIGAIDVGVHLPLYQIETETSPAWWPTFDIAVSGGVGTTPRATYAESVVAADVASTLLLWGGLYRFVQAVTMECQDDCENDDATIAGAALVTGLVGTLVLAPALHGSQGNGKGAMWSGVLRLASLGAGMLLGAAGGEPATGALLGVLGGSLVAPFYDGWLAHRFTEDSRRR